MTWIKTVVQKLSIGQTFYTQSCRQQKESTYDGCTQKALVKAYVQFYDMRWLNDLAQYHHYIIKSCNSFGTLNEFYVLHLDFVISVKKIHAHTGSPLQSILVSLLKKGVNYLQQQPLHFKKANSLQNETTVYYNTTGLPTDATTHRAVSSLLQVLTFDCLFASTKSHNSCTD